MWNGIGTDTLAVACILAGAGLSGVASLALRGDGDRSCLAAVEPARAHAPRVIVRSGGSSVVVGPRLHAAGGMHGCDELRVEVRARMDESEARLDEARVRMEEARVRVEEARIRIEERKARLHGWELSALEPVLDVLEQEIEAELEREIERLEEDLSRRTAPRR